MYEDYYSDDDEKVESKMLIYYHNNITKILINAKSKIKNYLKVSVHLTQKELNKIYKGGGPTTITLFAKDERNLNFANLVNDRSTYPSILYITEEQCITYIYHYNKGGKFKLTLSKKQLSDTLKEIKRN